MALNLNRQADITRQRKRKVWNLDALNRLLKHAGAGIHPGESAKLTGAALISGFTLMINRTVPVRNKVQPWEKRCLSGNRICKDADSLVV